MPGVRRVQGGNAVGLPVGTSPHVPRTTCCTLLHLYQRAGSGPLGAACQSHVPSLTPPPLECSMTHGPRPSSHRSDRSAHDTAADRRAREKELLAQLAAVLRLEDPGADRRALRHEAPGTQGAPSASGG